MRDPLPSYKSHAGEPLDHAFSRAQALAIDENGLVTLEFNGMSVIVAGDSKLEAVRDEMNELVERGARHETDPETAEVNAKGRQFREQLIIREQQAKGRPPSI
jgi:hypothetical protein